MTSRQLAFWNGVNACLIVENLTDAAVKGSAIHLALACLAMLGLYFGMTARAEA